MVPTAAVKKALKTGRAKVMDANSRIYADSEIGKLKKVIVHRPDEGIARITPKRAGELLFDDIVHLPNMQDEHDIFINVLRAFLGKDNVLEVRDLLAESTRDEESKYEVINKITDFEEFPIPLFRASPAYRRNNWPILSLRVTSNRKTGFYSTRFPT
jgi:arginine deiminase